MPIGSIRAGRKRRDKHGDKYDDDKYDDDKYDYDSSDDDKYDDKYDDRYDDKYDDKYDKKVPGNFDQRAVEGSKYCRKHALNAPLKALTYDAARRPALRAAGVMTFVERTREERHEDVQTGV